jgi:hypothetical protein
METHEKTWHYFENPGKIDGWLTWHYACSFIGNPSNGINSTRDPQSEK